MRRRLRATAADSVQVPDDHDARQTLEWLCGEESDAGLVRALLRLRRGEWHDDELNRLQQMVGKEVRHALHNLEVVCEWSEERRDYVESLEALRTPQLDEASASLRFLAGLGRCGEWLSSWEALVGAQQERGYVKQDAVDALMSGINGSTPFSFIRLRAVLRVLRTVPPPPSTLPLDGRLQALRDTLGDFNINGNSFLL